MSTDRVWVSDTVVRWPSPLDRPNAPFERFVVVTANAQGERWLVVEMTTDTALALWDAFCEDTSIKAHVWPADLLDNVAAWEQKRRKVKSTKTVPVLPAVFGQLWEIESKDSPEQYYAHRGAWETKFAVERIARTSGRRDA